MIARLRMFPFAVRHSGLGVAVAVLMALGSPACSSKSGKSHASNADAGGDSGMADVARDSGEQGIVQPTTGPGKVLNLAAAMDPSTLALQIKTSSSGLIPVTSVHSKVYKIDFTFTSQTLWGQYWTHEATLFVPVKANPALAKGAFVVVQFGTQNTVRNVSDSSVFRTNYAARLTAMFGIPSLVVPNLPGPVDLNQAPASWHSRADPSCFGPGLPPTRYAPCLLQVLQKTGDPAADPFRYLAFGWMRAMTAAQQVATLAATTTWSDHGPGSLDLSRALILAAGARAVAARMASSVDPRIDGVFGAADFGALPQLLATMKSDWSHDYGWFTDPGAFATWLQTDAGKKWRQTVDPAMWSGMLQGKSFVNATGTNDPFFPLVAYKAFSAGFPRDTRRVIVDDYANGIGAQDELSDWYAFVTHVYLGRPWQKPTMTASPSAGSINVKVTADGQSTLGKAVVWSVQQQREGDDADFRDAVWVSAPMTGAGTAKWTANVAPLTTHTAVYADVRDAADVPTILGKPATVTVAGSWSTAVYTSP